jgi:hypothetical protein
MMEPQAPASPQRQRRSLAIVVLLVVAIGAGLVGASLDRAYVRNSAKLVGDTAFHPISSALRSPSAADRKQYLDELTAALALTPAQVKTVDSITQRRAGQFEELRRSIRPRVEAMIDTVRSEIETVLTAEQREKYRKLRPVPDSSTRSQ